jgi:hypothetical protein
MKSPVQVNIGDRIYYSCGCHSLIISMPILGMSEQRVLGKSCISDCKSSDGKTFYSKEHQDRKITKVVNDKVVLYWQNGDVLDENLNTK